MYVCYNAMYVYRINVSKHIRISFFSLLVQTIFGISEFFFYIKVEVNIQMDDNGKHGNS